MNVGAIVMLVARSGRGPRDGVSARGGAGAAHHLSLGTGTTTARQQHRPATTSRPLAATAAGPAPTPAPHVLPLALNSASAPPWTRDHGTSHTTPDAITTPIILYFLPLRNWLNVLQQTLYKKCIKQNFKLINYWRLDWLTDWLILSDEWYVCAVWHPSRSPVCGRLAFRSVAPLCAACQCGALSPVGCVRTPASRRTRRRSLKRRAGAKHKPTDR